MGTERTWHPTRRSDAFDLALTAVLGVAAGVSLYMGGEPALWDDWSDYSRPLGIGLVTVIVAPLVVRRRYPVTVLAVSSTALLPLMLLQIPERNITVFAHFIALYTAGAYGRRHRDLVRVFSVLVLTGLVAYEIAFQDSELDQLLTYVPVDLFNAFQAFTNAVYLVAGWMLGDLVRNRRQREATLEAQADELRRAQDERARRAVLEERLHIARELHDVVAHHVSVMGVQAGAARRMLDRQPEAVPELMGSVENASRQAIGELQRMLGVLRRDEAGAGPDPTGGVARQPPPEPPAPASNPPVLGPAPAAQDPPSPTLGQLESLVSRMRHAGLQLNTQVLGIEVAGPRSLPVAVDTSAYRIVQEALTNTLKHAGPAATAEVWIARDGEVLEVRVSDDGAGSATSTGQRPQAANGATAVRSGGHGLTGMRERVALLGGELQAGRRPDGGFEVRARLPLHQDRVG